MAEATGLLKTYFPEVWAKLTRTAIETPSTEPWHSPDATNYANEFFTNYLNGGHKFNEVVPPALRDAAWHWLRSYGGTFSFLVDLKAKVDKGLALNPKQTAGVLNCMAADVRKKLAATNPVATLPVDKLPSCKVVVPVTLVDGTVRDVKVVVDRPGPKTRWYGWVFVKTHRWKDGYSAYYVKPDGSHQNRLDRIPPMAASESEVALKKLCADPLGVIAASGHLTNRCGICNRELSDADSVRLGIGPVCLKKTQTFVSLGASGLIAPTLVAPTPAPVVPTPAAAPETPAAPLRTLAEVLAERDAKEAQTPVEAVSVDVPVERPRQARSVATRPRKNRAARE